MNAESTRPEGYDYPELGVLPDTAFPRPIDVKDYDHTHPVPPTGPIFDGTPVDDFDRLESIEAEIDSLGSMLEASIEVIAELRTQVTLALLAAGGGLALGLGAFIGFIVGAT